jgi:hypothetical protein
MTNDPTRAPAYAMPVYIAPAIGSVPTNLATNASTLIYTGPGYVASLNVNTAGTTSTIKIYDGTDNTGILLGTWSTTAQGSFPINLPFVTGLFVITAGGAAADLTISYVPG